MQRNINITVSSDELDMICCALDINISSINDRFANEEDESVRELKELRDRMYDLLFEVMQKEKQQQQEVK